ncbi:MAG: FAD-binding protein [Thermoplasmata archaeon]
MPVFRELSDKMPLEIVRNPSKSIYQTSRITASKIAQSGAGQLSGPIQSSSQSAHVSNMNELQSILIGCRDRGQPVVTIDSPILRTSNWMSVDSALQLDLSGMNSVFVDAARRLAVVGPGAKYSALRNAAQTQGMVVDIEPLACIDFTFGDWAHESLRMLSSINSGIDGVLRNVKVVAPDMPYQTGYDDFPANGGGYDLTKMFMTSYLTLGVPYEFAIPVRPASDVMARKTYSFSKLEKAVRAGIAMHKSGFASVIKAASSNIESTLSSGEVEKSDDFELAVKFEGIPAIVEAAEKLFDEIAKKEGGKERENSTEPQKLIAPSSISTAVWLMGVFPCDTLGLASVVEEIVDRASKAGRAAKFYVSDIDPNVSILVPILQGPPAPEIVRSIGSYLVDRRITLRGNVAWNSLLGDSRSRPRLELLRRVKSHLDSRMILNAHMMGAI